MKTRSFHFMGISLVLCLTFNQVDAKVDSRGIPGSIPRGLASSRANLYLPDATGHWRCLDGSKTIPFSAINDDYCDCKDGSDEPGTAACGSGYFYCANAGHAPSYIKSSRINDGVCEPECCDGSDEFDGQISCPDVCEHVGYEARKERERVRLIQKEGSKLRQEYITFGKDAKKRLQKKLEQLESEKTRLQESTLGAKAELDKANAKHNEYLERTKTLREAARKVQLEPLIEEHKKRLTYAKEIEGQLLTALKDLKENYNKNYHDLAVKSAVTGFDEYMTAIEEAKTDEQERTKEEGTIKETIERTSDEIMLAISDETYEVRKEIGAMFQLLKGMKESYNTENNDEAVQKALKTFDDFAPSWRDEQSEFQYEESIEIPPEETDEPSEMPEAEKSQGVLNVVMERVQKGAKSLGLGRLFPEARSESEVAQEAYNAKSEAERKVNDEVQDIERKLKIDYGKDEAFAKLADECLEFKDIEYTYSLCFFGSATQKSHSDTSLGTFSSWVGDNYDTQMYTGGLRCWNGPERSVKVEMSCGKTNEIVAVSEPEKCEYLYKVRTPAVCRMIPDSEDDSMDVVPEAVLPGSNTGVKHDEL